jgi:hypothetical protein
MSACLSGAIPIGVGGYLRITSQRLIPTNSFDNNAIVDKLLPEAAQAQSVSFFEDRFSLVWRI